jgi:hypothetical protein
MAFPIPSAPGSSDPWRNQQFKALSGGDTARQSVSGNPLSLKVSGGRKGGEFPSADFGNQISSCLAEDPQFYQWLVLTGRIFDPNYFPASLLSSPAVFGPEGNHDENPLDDYFLH